MEIELVEGCGDGIDQAEQMIDQCMRDFADWIYKQLEAEHNYQMSDEQIDESIKCNEVEFSEDGSYA
jgi:hypothetical protein